MCWQLAKTLILLGCLQRVLSIEHDSICTTDDVCPEPSHTVMRLREKDDKKAHLIAKQHGLEIKVNYYRILSSRFSTLIDFNI